MDSTGKATANMISHAPRVAKSVVTHYSEITDCQLCGEGLDFDSGEFWDKAQGTSVVAHAQCGIDADLPLA